jgi:N-acetylglutamate synthase-like GNAT family acetyltransferase
MTIYKKIDKHNLAVIETVPMNHNTKLRLLTRIHVPTVCRRKGMGTYLLSTLCELCDRDGITLIFPNPSKPKVYVTKWLQKNKFISYENEFMYRLPNGLNEEVQYLYIEYKKMMDD